ncbi:hypothetical protein ST37_14385 [Vibrio sp. qd031]|nr:hypothetical protein ST37_14385 [Vibrio sp. qd031]
MPNCELQRQIKANSAEASLQQKPYQRGITRLLGRKSETQTDNTLKNSALTDSFSIVNYLSH